MNGPEKSRDPAPALDIPGPAAWDNVGRPRQGRRRPGEMRAPRRQASPGQGRGPLARVLIGLFWLALGPAVAGLAGLFGLYAYFAQDLPATAGLKNYSPPTVTYFYADDGRVVGEYYHQRRFVLPLDEIPPLVRNAFIAVEDAAFYEHKGVNFRGIFRAALATLEEGRVTQGASSITMQVVRAFLLTPERTLSRKIREMILAFRLEGDFSKDYILYLYLNEIYLGRGAYGVEAAARTYFDKSAADLTIAEAAMLAGITQAPGRNPVSNPEQARARQAHGLKRMMEVGFITEEQRQAALAEVLNIRGDWSSPNLSEAPYFAEHVRRLMEEKVGAESLYNDGWKVYTTVNLDAQRAADRAVAQGLWEYARRRGYRGPEVKLETEEALEAFRAASEKSLPETGLSPDRLYKAAVLGVDDQNGSLALAVGPYEGRVAREDLSWALKAGQKVSQRFSRGDVVWARVRPEAPAAGVRDLAALAAGEAGAEPLDMFLEANTDLQSALMSMEADTGDVLAMVGGRDFGESQFNRAVQSQRQPGSSFKPILYTAAMEHGFTPASIMIDAPFVVEDVGNRNRWKPVNSDSKFRGPMTLFQALTSSRNLISIKLLDRLGFEPLFTTARAMGITETLPASLAVALGAYGLHMPEMVTAFSTFPNMGTRVTPRYITRIEDRHGRVVESFEVERTPAVDPGAACAVTWMLRGVVAFGTGTAVKPLGRPVGGKTGTTNDFSDAWFIGFTPELVTAVWLGTDQQRPRAVGEVGGVAAAPIFLYYMREVLKDKPVREFTVPPEAVVQPGGEFGICYKAGTVGRGFSETGLGPGTEEGNFLRGDFDGGTFEPETDGDSESLQEDLPEGLQDIRD
ncbi:MAG: PBP1A family penicillin-binding protein [Candidatus Adiutrix sp.]|jgi:penicillin-binding protein 1A|nr:PBP1A family penicillin-binding protein [Candidatus Adiutrix sp.]